MASTARDRRESAAVLADPIAVAAPRPPKPRWFSGVSGILRPGPQRHQPQEFNANDLLAFPSETNLPPERERAAAAAEPSSSEPPTTKGGASPKRRSIVLALVIVVGVAGGFGLVTLRRLAPAALGAAAPRTGSLTINTEPPAADVLVDGNPRGTSPLTMALAPGPHTITVRTDRDSRVVQLTIAPGAEITQHFEMKTRVDVPQVGRVSVVTEPPGAKVSVDGRPRGAAPLVVADLHAGEHTVTVASDAGSSERKVVVTPGGTAAIVFSLASKASGPIGGWLSLSAPFDVEITENGDVIGASRATRIMLAAGRHDVVLANRSLGYQETKRIDVVAGRTTTVRVEPPQASMSVNARPWAEIVMDGTSIGQTPIANLQVSVGSHELVFRNPQLGERRQTVIVTAHGPNRIAADLTNTK